MKSGKHFNASESLDNLPLTHPEHFSTPVGGASGGRRRRKGGNDSGDEYDSSSDCGNDNVASAAYVANIGRVVCVEITETKKGKVGLNFLILSSWSLCLSSTKYQVEDCFL